VVAFCSDLARTKNRIDPIIGSAHTARGFILITWPKRHWARQQFKSHGIPFGIADRLKAIQVSSKYFIRLVTKTGMTSEQNIQLFAMPDGFSAEVSDWDGVISLLESAFRDPSQTALTTKNGWQPYRKRMLVCCTNGVRDRCCAKYGFAFVKQAQALADRGEHSMDVWQSTHLAGDRFAATAITLPDGDMYGWLRAEIAKSFIADVEHGKLPEGLFRGNAYLSEPDQIVDFCVRRQLRDYIQRADQRPVSDAEYEHDENEVVARVSALLTINSDATRSIQLTGTIRMKQEGVNAMSDCRNLDRGEHTRFQRLQVVSEDWDERS